MVGFLIGDAIFLSLVFVQTIAIVSFLNEIYHLQFSVALMPILRSYHESLVNLLPKEAQGLIFASPYAFADAYLVAAILFYLFFIKAVLVYNFCYFKFGFDVCYQP